MLSICLAGVKVTCLFDCSAVNARCTAAHIKRTSQSNLRTYVVDNRSINEPQRTAVVSPPPAQKRLSVLSRQPAATISHACSTQMGCMARRMLPVVLLLLAGAGSGQPDSTCRTQQQYTALVILASKTSSFENVERCIYVRTSFNCNRESLGSSLPCHAACSCATLLCQQ